MRHLIVELQMSVVYLDSFYVDSPVIEKIDLVDGLPAHIYYPIFVKTSNFRCVEIKKIHQMDLESAELKLAKVSGISDMLLDFDKTDSIALCSYLEKAISRLQVYKVYYESLVRNDDDIKNLLSKLKELQEMCQLWGDSEIRVSWEN